MKLKKALTLFCFLVLMFQLLPVWQLGKLLFQNSLTEELPHDNCTPDCKDHFPFKKVFTFSHYQSNFFVTEKGIPQYIHLADALPLHVAGEIHTPPPNLI